MYLACHSSSFPLTVASVLRISILCLFPIFFADLSRNPVTQNQVLLLQSNNVASNSTADCEFLYFAVQSWLRSTALVQTSSGIVARRNYLVLWAQLLPVRCGWQRKDGVITVCDIERPASLDSACDFWEGTLEKDPTDVTVEYFANNTRPEGIIEIISQTSAPADFADGQTDALFKIRALFDESHVIELT